MYVNAKVVLLGDSGVDDRWEKAESSHGTEIQRLVLPGAGDNPDVVCELSSPTEAMRWASGVMAKCGGPR